MVTRFPLWNVVSVSVTVSAETINQFGFRYRYRTETKIVVSVVHYFELTYGFVATPIYSKEPEGDSCFASIHPANRNKIQYTNMKQFLNWNKNERNNLVWKIRNRKHVALANAVSFSRMFTKPRPTMEPKPLWWDIWILFRFMKYF